MDRLRSDSPLAWLVALLAIVLCLACEARERPSLLLITVDTLRADALSPYGVEGVASFDGGNTPASARLAAQGTLFEHARVPMPLTRPSHASIFTSRHPREHGVLNNQIALPESALTLAEVLSEAGYRTGAVVSVKLLDAASGAAQGFEQLESPQTSLEWSGGEVVQRAIGWLDGLSEDEHFFLWVHLFDPHQPYDPPPEHRAHVDPALAARHPSLEWADFKKIARKNRGDIPAEIVGHARSLYRGEVEATDAWLGQLLGALDRLRSPENTMVILTADHGECFESGQYFEHSDCLLEGALRIPLLIRYPEEFSPGARIQRAVSSLDIGPTMLRAAGLPIPAAFDGTPLDELDASPTSPILVQQPFYQPGVVPARQQRQVVIRTIEGAPVREFDFGKQTIGLVTDEWKYLRGPDGEELYGLKPRPDEVQNVAAAEPATRKRLATMLDETLEARPLTLLDPGEINPELLDDLRALGYIE